MNAYLLRVGLEKIRPLITYEGDHWIYNGCVTIVPMCSIENQPHPVRKVMWQERYGEYPSQRMKSTCGEKRCIRPEHARVAKSFKTPFWRTHAYRRELRGEIRALRGCDTAKRIGSYYNMTHNYIQDIWDGRVR